MKGQCQKWAGASYKGTELSVTRWDCKGKCQEASASPFKPTPLQGYVPTLEKKRIYVSNTFEVISGVFWSWILGSPLVFTFCCLLI